MLSFGMLTERALSMAYRSFRFISGSPPPWRAAMMMARLSLLNSLPRLASMAPFLCLIVAQCEWPDMAPPSWLRLRLQELELVFEFLVAVVRLAPPVLLVQGHRLVPGG